MATDTAITNLTAIAGGSVATNDEFAVADVSATATKAITLANLVIALGENGGAQFQLGAPADGDVANSSAIFYLDTAVSPYTFNVKCKDSGGTVFSFTL